MQWLQSSVVMQGVCMLRGDPAADDQSISAILQRIRQQDGSPLPRLRFWSESSIMFFAGKCILRPASPHFVTYRLAASSVSLQHVLHVGV